MIRAILKVILNLNNSVVFRNEKSKWKKMDYINDIATRVKRY